MFAFRKSDVDAEPEESPGSSSSGSSTSSSRGAIDALSTGAAPAHASAGGAVQRGEGFSSDSDSSLDSSTGEEEEEEDDPAMFSSKFLSGANPLSAVSSAVNKFGLFGDDGEGDKKQQPGGGPGKDSQQQQSFQKPGQGPSMQKSQPTSKQGPPQLHRDKQTEPKSKPVGQAQSSNTGTEPLPKQPKAPQQQGSAKPGGQQQAAAKSGIQAESTKVSPKPNMQQNPSKAGVQQKDSTKTGAQGETKVGSQVGQQQQTSSKVGPEKEAIRAAPQQPPSDKQHEVKRAGTPDLKSSGAATNARSQSKAQPRCPVCNTTELNVHSKEPPNHRTCTQCKSEVCSLCGFSPPDSDVSKAPHIINIPELEF